MEEKPFRFSLDYHELLKESILVNSRIGELLIEIDRFNELSNKIGECQAIEHFATLLDIDPRVRRFQPICTYNDLETEISVVRNLG